MQTVGVNAAKTTDTIKFPRFTLGCIPRRQEEREEGTTEEEVRRKEAVEEGDHKYDREQRKKRDRCKKTQQR